MRAVGSPQLTLLFALAAAGHVLNEGLKAGKRSQYELVLVCSGVGWLRYMTHRP